MTNRADSQNSGHSPSTRQSRKRPLTDRDGISLRSELRDLSQLGDRPVSWDLATDRWRNYIRDKEDVQSVFENSETGETGTDSKPHRFHEEYEIGRAHV